MARKKSIYPWDPGKLVTGRFAFWAAPHSRYETAGADAWYLINQTDATWRLTAGTDPSLNTPDATTGLQSVQFNGTSQYLNQTITAFRDQYKGQSAAWIFAVFRITTLDSSNTTRPLYEVVTNAGSPYATRFAVNLGRSGVNKNTPGLTVRRLDADAATFLYGTEITDTNYHMMLVTMDWANGAGTIYQDGVSVASNSTLTSAGNTSDTSPATNVYVGGFAPGAAYCRVVLSDLIGGVGAIPAAGEIDRLFGFFAWTRNLTGLLASDHPYKNYAP